VVLITPRMGVLGVICNDDHKLYKIKDPTLLPPMLIAQAPHIS
jgi:hypothetical protein